MLLHALCPGCVWLAHVPDEKTCLRAVPSCQLLPVSCHSHFLFSQLAAPASFQPCQCISFHTSGHSLSANLPRPNAITELFVQMRLHVWSLHFPNHIYCLNELIFPPVSSCHHLSPCSCTSMSGSRMSQSVTVEEDNCCGCNVLAIRRHFLDRDLKQVQIVYTSCHDAVSSLTSRSLLPGDCHFKALVSKGNNRKRRKNRMHQFFFCDNKSLINVSLIFTRR